MPYRGSDLSSEFKSFFRKEKNRLKKILEARGCTKIELDYGFYYFSGFFTAPSGQIYYLSSSDVRDFGYNKLLIRTAKHYKDWTGGMNQYCGIDAESLNNFRLE